MGAVVADISMSLDGFVAGPDDGVGRGLGEGGEPIHNWVMGGPWTYSNGADFAASGVDREEMDDLFSAAGAIIIGRRMYDVVDGWGDESAAGDKDVSVGGGARIIQQFLAAGLVDTMQIHVAPVLVGGGTRLFEHLGATMPHLEQVRVRESPNATHIRYRVVRP